MYKKTDYSIEGVMNNLQSRKKVGKYKVKNVTKDGLTREVSVFLNHKHNIYIYFLLLMFFFIVNKYKKMLTIT